jgi:hypothetical protein
MECPPNTSFLIMPEYVPYITKRLIVVVCFLLGSSPASEFYMPMFRNIPSVKYSNILKPSHSSYLPAYEDVTDGAFRNIGI